MSTTDNEDIIQYVPFMSFVHPSFWHTLTKMKLEVDHLNDTSRPIFGRFTYRDDIGSVFEIDGPSFNRTIPQSEPLYENVAGTIMNKNTIEEFKTLDKSSLLNSVGEIIWANIKNKSWITNPSVLLNFYILSFADLKKFSYYYWFAFPAPSQPTVHLKRREMLTDVFNNRQIQDLTDYMKLDNVQRSFFAVINENERFNIKSLSEILDSNVTSQKDFHQDLSKVCFVFSDPSNGQNPGWPLRLFLAALLEHCPFLSDHELQIIALRCNKTGSIQRSQFFKIYVPMDVKSVESAGWVGWERNERGNFGPKLANMSASMDPIKLADASSDLNIRLMKWRLVPDINLDIMKNSKCLLLGAGTLGCHVARDLLAWGFRNITFVDNGTVSYSNPTRQVLFNHNDCRGGGRKKAEAAAENLKNILPSANTKSLVLHIPMPGHPVGEALAPETIRNMKMIIDAISEHDVIFLLLDTREARWMPTVIAQHLGKIVINAALGFDSYLVMRHGIHTSTKLDCTGVASKYVPGSQLGCYFCNDVTAPGDSLKDRTLDQQCTVTRPGVAAIAGALAVELLVALLQHKLGVDAPAAYNLNDEVNKGIDLEAQSCLGPIPHSIRGFLWSYQTVLPTCTKFKQCIACSDAVIEKYKEEGMEFFLKVFDNAKYLEDVTGLSELHLSAEMTDILTLDDSEDES